MRTARVLFVFVDGVGLGEVDPATNPFARARTPTLRALLGQPLAGAAAVETNDATLVPLDARLGVGGLPQSATGQTALLTGENAPALLGRHVTAYPTPTLRNLLASHGLFVRLRRAGVPASLANAYSDGYFEAVASRRLRHAAVALNALQGDVRFRNLDDLRAGRAVHHDLTNAGLRRHGVDVPAVTAHAAGRRLAEISAAQPFTLFEFFQTDLAGHGRIGDRVGVVERFDAFLGGILAGVDLGETLLLVTSDHGNVEDERTDSHTLNPVPALLVGARRRTMAPRLRAITDVAPACMDLVTPAAPVP